MVKLMITSDCAKEFLSMTDAQAKEMGLYSRNIARLALLMWYENTRMEDEEDRPLTQSEPWCVGDYDGLRYRANLIVKSNITKQAVKSLL